MAPSLPPFAPFPESVAWRDTVSHTEWATCLDSWLALARAHLALADAEFAELSIKDESLMLFLPRLFRGLAISGKALLGDSPAAHALKKACYFLTTKVLQQSAPDMDSPLVRWEAISDFCCVYGKRRAGSSLQKLSASAVDRLESSLLELKKFLVKDLDAGIRGDLKTTEERLRRVNYLVDAWPRAAALLLAGSDYVDALVTGFRVMNPPLRQCIVTNLYLCLVGMTEGSTPSYSHLTDILYSLKGAAEDHKKSTLNARDCLVGELLKTTPALPLLRQRAQLAPSSTSRMVTVLKDLEKLSGSNGGALRLPQKRLATRRDKGKAPASEAPGAPPGQLSVHRWSQISQIQDLFPDLGSAFVVRLLEAYNDNPEEVVAHLLEDTLPPHLASADRSENLPSQTGAERRASLAPRSTPPLLPSRQNAFDDDELTMLASQTSRLHFGKQKSGKTADDILRDRSQAPRKAAILSALAAFDADDDERDDTYDAADVGGTVDNTTATDGDDLQDAKEGALFAAYQATPAAFNRDAATRRGDARARLREETGMTDEAIEGWGLMLARNPQQKRRLEARFSAFTGAQTELARTSWRAHGEEDEDNPTKMAEQDRRAEAAAGRIWPRKRKRRRRRRRRRRSRPGRWRQRWKCGRTVWREGDGASPETKGSQQVESCEPQPPRPAGTKDGSGRIPGLNGPI